MGYQEAYKAFLAQDAEEAILKATETGWGGNTYHVELYFDGTYRGLYSGEIGNLYVSPGIIIGVPALSDDEYNSEEPALSIFDGALEGLDEAFAEKMERIEIPSKPEMVEVTLYTVWVFPEFKPADFDGDYRGLAWAKFGNDNEGDKYAVRIEGDTEWFELEMNADDCISSYRAELHDVVEKM